jgi:hypothetical protein
MQNEEFSSVKSVKSAVQFHCLWLAAPRSQRRGPGPFLNCPISAFSFCRGNLRLRSMLSDGIGLGNKPIAAHRRRFVGTQLARAMLLVDCWKCHFSRTDAWAFTNLATIRTREP